MEKFTTALKWITGIDPDLWGRTPFWNQATIAAEFSLLFLVAMISGVAWGQFWGISGSWWSAVMVGITASMFMFLLDRLIVSSDWRLGGIFRHRDAFFGWEVWTRLAMRIAMTAVFSIATSTGAEMAMCYEAIHKEIVQSVQAENRRTAAYYAVEINNLIQRDIGQQAWKMKAMQTLVDDLTPEVDRDKQAVVDATERLRLANENVDRELTGKDGRRGGKGDKYRADESQADAATSDIAKANNLLTIYQPRLDEARGKLLQATADYGQAKATIQPKIDALENERDAHFESPRQDALLSFQALGRVLSDPEKGHEATWFGWLMFGVLMTIELSFLIVRTIFGQTSIYTALQIKDARDRMKEIEGATPDRTFTPIRFILARSRTEAGD